MSRRVIGGFECGTQPLCQLEGVLPRRIRQQARELFTSHSAEQIGRPQLRSRQGIRRPGADRDGDLRQQSKRRPKPS